MFDENIEIRDESEYQQEGMSVKETILRHIRKISDLCCQEFTGGFWEEKPIKTQSGILLTRTWHDDVREAYCNAVDFLIDIVYPSADKDLKQYLDDNESIGQDIEIKKKLVLKRNTFRQINIFFEREDFWTSTGVSSE